MNIDMHVSHMTTLFPWTRAIACACTSTHASKFTCAIYHTREIIFSLFLLLYIFHKENVPKCHVHFGWKDILFELLG